MWTQRKFSYVLRYVFSIFGLDEKIINFSHARKLHGVAMYGTYNSKKCRKPVCHT